MTSLRKIKIPAPLKANIDGKPGEYRLIDYIAYLVDNQVKFNDSGPGIRAGINILNKLEKAMEEKKEELIINEKEWMILLDVSESPNMVANTVGYPFTPARLLIVFLDAIKDAEIAEAA